MNFHPTTKQTNIQQALLSLITGKHSHLNDINIDDCDYEPKTEVSIQIANCVEKKRNKSWEKNDKPREPMTKYKKQV